MIILLKAADERRGQLRAGSSALDVIIVNEQGLCILLNLATEFTEHTEIEHTTSYPVPSVSSVALPLSLE
jgi:hypothetical protein